MGWLKRPLPTSAALATVIGCLFIGRSPPVAGGFRCGDEQIAQEFVGQDTFPARWLIIGTLLPMLIIMSVREFYHLEAKKRNISSAVVQAWPAYVTYVAHCGLTLWINELIKVLVGRPRPHFLSTCQPDWKRIDCGENNDGFVPYDASLCMTTNDYRNGVPKAVYDVMKSFPSGHAQLSTFVAIFAVIYIQRNFSSSVKHAWQIMFAWFAWSASSTRVSDNRHHLTDVLGGSLIGAVMSAWVVIFQFNSFYDEQENSSKDLKNE